MPLRARDLMQTELVTVRPDMPYLQIQHLFAVAQIGGAPVVDERGATLGVISATDLLRAADQAFDEDLDPAPDDRPSPPARADAGARAVELPEQLAALTAIDLATPDPIWISPDCEAAEAARIMRAEGIHRLLVGEGGRLAGILSAFDLLRAIPA